MVISAGLIPCYLQAVWRNAKIAAPVEHAKRAVGPAEQCRL
jgi:hypothetical protein